MRVHILVNATDKTPGKLADAELHFEDHDGMLAGLKLIGFAVWQSRGPSGFNVTFPARQYSVNGERRSFSLLRPVLEPAASETVRAAILAAYQQAVAEVQS